MAGTMSSWQSWVVVPPAELNARKDDQPDSGELSWRHHHGAAL